MQDDSTVYKIPKTWVWFLVSIFFLWILYKATDFIIHANWPPADTYNQVFIKNLNEKYKCNNGNKYSVTQQMLDGVPATANNYSLGIDRKIFFEHPECNGARLYLAYEGSGIREKIDIYDMTTKQRTASFVITHEKFVPQ